MKEKLYTIPLNDAVAAADECPFCFVEREVEQDLLDYVLGAGSSYMESDVRDATDREGFCRRHLKQMFDYGNTLGNGWIMKTHYLRLRGEMEAVFAKYAPDGDNRPAKVRPSLFSRSGPLTGSVNPDKTNRLPDPVNPLARWVRGKEDSCYICKRFNETFARYMDTFFHMYKNDPAFREKIAQSKGFCLSHFGGLCEAAESKLNENEKRDFYPAMCRLMSENMERLAGDVAWLVEKFDYRNHEADWRDSRDAIQRGMQKLRGGYPADPPYGGS